MGKIEKTIISDFWGPPSNDGKEYHKILSGCSMGSKYLLNFTCLPMKFHKRGHTSVGFVALLQTVDFIQNDYQKWVFNL